MRVSFGRIIPIVSVTAPDCSVKKKRVDNSTYDVAKVLNSEKTSAYSRAESASIRNYFQSILGDYNGKNGILMKRTNRGDVVLISGKDAQTIKEMEKNKKNPEKAQEKINELIYAKLENGHGKKKESLIILDSSKLSRDSLNMAQIYGDAPIKAKLDKIAYLNLQSYYTAQLDGFMRKDIEPTDKETCENQCENIIAEYQELKL